MFRACKQPACSELIIQFPIITTPHTPDIMESCASNDSDSPISPLKSHATIPPHIDPSSRPALHHVETSNTLSGATLASRQQSVSEEHNDDADGINGAKNGGGGHGHGGLPYSPDLKSKGPCGVDGLGSWPELDTESLPGPVPAPTPGTQTAATTTSTGSRFGAYKSTGLRSKLFQTVHNQPDEFMRADNFAPESDVDVLCISSDTGASTYLLYASLLTCKDPSWVFSPLFLFVSLPRSTL